MPRRLLAPVLIACALPAQEPEFVTPLPTAENLATWKDYVLPSPDEVRWEAIPWLQTFGDGMRTANEQGKPLLFWAMNGHPLGCT